MTSKISMGLEEITKTCLHRFVGDCKDCKRDYGDKHPNNRDCPNYKEIHVQYYEVFSED